MRHDMTKQTKWVCAQRRLRSAWASAQSDQSSLCAQWVAKDPSVLHADSEDSDQTWRMPRLIWVFAGHTCHLVVFFMRRLIYLTALKTTGTATPLKLSTTMQNSNLPGMIATSQATDSQTFHKKSSTMLSKSLPTSIFSSSSTVRYPTTLKSTDAAATDQSTPTAPSSCFRGAVSTIEATESYAANSQKTLSQ